MKRLIAAIVVATTAFFMIVFGSSAGWSAADLRSLKSGVWVGAVRADDQGNATSCYLAAQKRNKAFWIILKLDGLGLHVILYNKNWALPEGDKFRSRVVIDKHLFGRVDAVVATTTGIDFLIGNDEPSMESLRAGSRISFSTPQGKKSFRLQGTRKAIDKLLDCSDRYLAASDGDSAPSSYEAGLKAFNAKDYAGAFMHWQRLAQEGDAKSQNALGILYYNGKGVKKDLVQAAEWFRRSSDQDYGQAQNNLGEMYRDGEGVPQNDARAVELFQAAAINGVDKASENVVAMLTAGRGIGETQSTSPAEMDDDADALVDRAIGILAEAQVGTPEDAFRLADQAARLGSSQGQYFSGLMLIDGVGVAKDYKLGIARMLAAAKAGDMDALTFMGTQYLQDGNDTTNAIGIDYLNRAADMGSTEAQAALSFYQSEAVQ